MQEPVAAQHDVYPVASHRIPGQALDEGRYRVRFARDLDELDQVQALRFQVFNVELGEGLEESWRDQRDRDPFDAICHHLIVEDLVAGTIVGTYRMQTADMARLPSPDHPEGLGFYSAGEFDLTAMPSSVVELSVEVGRACIALEHRNTQVLFLLWRGLALYIAHNNLRYFFGCCSLTSQDPDEGAAMARHLESDGRLHPTVRIDPLPALVCGGDADAFTGRLHVPKLFRIYLRHGALVCGPPAIDRQFKTIDFLVLFDVAAMDEKRVRTFFG
ncbi:MAG: GNAT family N-acyltransferase [Acidobacteriota bacterium]